VQDLLFLEREYDRIEAKFEGRIGHRENVEIDLLFVEEAQRTEAWKQSKARFTNQ
jgi:hypothetical protein